MTEKSSEPASISQPSSPPHAGLEEACARLLERVGNAVLDGDRLVRLEVEAPLVGFRDWLAVQEGVSRYYWRDRCGRVEMAGAGDAHVIEPDGEARISGAFEEILAKLPRNSPFARYYGGFRFHFNSKEDRRWRDFKSCRFVAPLVELFREGDTCMLACTLNGEAGRQEAGGLLRRLTFRFGLEILPLPVFHGRSDAPARPEWCAMVERALDHFRTSSLEKVVLARQTTFRAPEPVDPWALLQRLARKTQRVYLFCFQPNACRAFLGASPERLYSRGQEIVYSEALAGTRPRGLDAEQDEQYTNALCSDEKELREHRIVLEAIKDALMPFCSTLHAAETPEIVKLAHCQHLVSPIEGKLKPGVRDDALLAALHPTPAVGGKPADAAMRWILDNEPFERGVYASPVGWIGKDGAEFCVGIRSGLVLGDALSLYAGAGIVSGSDPEWEWRELDAKMAQFVDIISKEGEYGSD